MKKFEVGKVYIHYGSYDNEYYFTAIHRTKAYITFQRFDKTYKAKIRDFDRQAETVVIEGMILTA